MELKPGMSAFVTGGASGIGKALSLALAQRGLFVTIVDFSEERGKEAASIVEKENSKFYSSLTVPSALFVKCDVTVPSDVAGAFEKHVETYGGLDVCINCAGIGTKKLFYEDTTDGNETWRRTVDVNLVALMDCTRIAVQIMRSKKKPGVIVNMGSASGLYPMYADPVYSGTKGGVVMFTRSLAFLKRLGIRVNVLCPEFVQTDIGLQANPKVVKSTGGFLAMDDVVKGMFELIKDDTRAGACLWVTKRRGLEYWPTPEEEKKYLTRRSKRNFTSPNFSSITIPQSFEKIVVHTLSHNFRSATKIIRTHLRLPIDPNFALVKVLYAGVNASDVNFSSGRYFGGKGNEAGARLPSDAGFEAVGIVASVGDAVHHVKVGSPAAFLTFGGYSEFSLIPAKYLLPVPRPDPEVVAMLTSGLTASIALEKAGNMKSGETVLVTAAAGGTGQFAVQLAKLGGNKVVATCGGQQKAVLLKSLGVDRVIDYKIEKIKDVLKTEYPKGVDIVYESVGGDMFNMCLNALAVHGRLVVIGMMSQYQGEHGWKPLSYPGLCEKILAKSQTVAGFFLIQHAHLYQEHLDRLFDLHATGKLKVALDPTNFSGLSSVADAVEYLHSGKSVGKVVVCVDPVFSKTLSKL
ncbi:hypothetical protein LUZ63_000410 [Rhynchospora breviuscula]|uniref:Enoyl reductase (ER) domain-containing protein n=1 Tax=Rhynchospora breviuscula TaxID=2022672 RepID=A0A9Q0HW48_9POAL|nr:hypothetical protein LUZ63_000410 [Rhynchospora breviuscula]